MSTNPDELTGTDPDDPSLPGYHWHSVAARRGWEQPTLDGSNGGHDPQAWLWRHQQEHHKANRPRLDTNETTPPPERDRPNR